MSQNKFAADENYSVRIFAEQEHEFRSKFDRDRDRILYSKAFRRLSGKTQVFMAGKDDHIRTRLTHTMEVSQIALTIAKNLDLNVSLTEAIALGHDIGHTPFGHVGERTLNLIMNGCYKIKNFNSKILEKDRGFKHNWQGVRVVSELEQLNRDYFGLNLTDYTNWGILNHSGLKYKKCDYHKRESSCFLSLIEETCHSPESNYKLNYYSRYNNQCYRKMFHEFACQSSPEGQWNKSCQGSRGRCNNWLCNLSHSLSCRLGLCLKF